MTLPRVQRPGSVHDMLASALDVVGPRRAAAADLQVSDSALSRMVDPDPENGRAFPAALLDRLGRAHPDAAAVIARHFAALAGGNFVPGDAGASAAEALASGLWRAAQANASLVEALADGKLDAEEAREVLPLAEGAADNLRGAVLCLTKAAAGTDDAGESA